MNLHMRMAHFVDRVVGRARVAIFRPEKLKSVIRADVVVTLTTYPARIGTVHRTLISLVAQDLPAPVILYLAREDFPSGAAALPKRLVALLHSLPSRLELRWVDRNTRSYKKLLPALTEFGGGTIATADDDVIYSPSWLSTLVDAANRHPGVVVGTRGTRMVRTPGGVLQPYASWPEAPAWVASNDTFLTGRGGILYPAGSLSPPVDDIDLALQLAPTADDVWFKAATIRAGFPSLRVPIRRDYPASGASQQHGLFRVNVEQKENDLAIANVFSHFDLRSPNTGGSGDDDVN